MQNNAKQPQKDVKLPTCAKWLQRCTKWQQRCTNDHRKILSENKDTKRPQRCTNKKIHVNDKDVQTEKYDKYAQNDHNKMENDHKGRQNYLYTEIQNDEKWPQLTGLCSWWPFTCVSPGVCCVITCHRGSVKYLWLIQITYSIKKLLLLKTLHRKSNIPCVWGLYVSLLWTTEPRNSSSLIQDFQK